MVRTRKYIFFLIAFLLICISEAYTQAPSIQWQKTLGGTNYEQALSVVQTFDEGFVAAGISTSANGNVTGNHGFGDFWIVKLDPSGVLQWQKSYGGSADDGAFCVAQTADGGFVVAGTSTSTNGNVTVNHGLEDYWVVKLDGSGNLQWQKSLGGNSVDIPYDIHQTSDLGFIIAGYTISNNGDVTGNHGLEDYWIVKLNSAGTLEWQKTFGGAMNDRASAIQQTTDGGYVAGGYTESTDGDVTGNHGDYDYWIVKLTSTGSLQWQKTLGGTSIDQAKTVQQTADGGFITAGFTASTNGDVTGNHGSEDLWMVKLNSSGVLQWQKSLGGTGVDQAYQIKELSSGGYVVAGSSYSTNGDVTGNHGGYDYWVARTDGNGTIIWQKSLGGSSVEEAYAISPTTNNGYIVGGGTLSTSGDVTGNHGDFDYWIVKLNEPIILDVELVSFEGINSEDKITLTWSTASELNNKGFELERSLSVENNFESIGWIEGHGNSMFPNSYFYDDTDVKTGIVYYYRLKQLDYNGSVSYSKVIAVKTSEEDLSLSIAPNPFSGSTNITYELKDKSNVMLEVFNATGQRISILYNGIQEKGKYAYKFNTQSSRYSTGIYIARLTIEGETIDMKLIAN
jgi:hypothetical protein